MTDAPGKFSLKSMQSLKVSLLAQAINILTAVVKTLIFTMFISPGNFGLIALTTSITGIIQLLKDFGYSTYIIQQKEIDQVELNAINTRVFLLGCVAFIFTCLVAYPITSFYKQTELLWIIPISGAQFIFNSFSIVPISVLRRNMEFNKIAKIEAGANIGSLLFGLILLFFIKNYWVLLFSGVSYLFFQLFIIVQLKSWQFHLINPFTSKLSKVGIRFGTQVTFFNVLSFISTNIDNFIIGKLFGQNILGVYSKGFEFGVTNIDKIKRPVQNVYFSDIADKENTERRNLFFHYIFFIVALLLVVIGPLLIYMDVIIIKFFGLQWKQLNVMLPPFLLSSFLWITMSFADQLLLVNFKMKKYLFLGIGKNTIGSASIIAASFWGVNAIAWSYLVYHALLFLPFCYYSFAARDLTANKINQMLIDTTILVLSSLATVTIPWLLSKYQIIQSQNALVLFIILCICLYTLIWKNIPSSKSVFIFNHFHGNKNIKTSAKYTNLNSKSPVSEIN